MAVCQVTSTPNKKENFKTCAELVLEAARLGACLAFLPEAFDFIARNPAETLQLSEPLDGDLMERYSQLARYKGGRETESLLGCVPGLPHRGGRALSRVVSVPSPQGMWNLAVLGWIPRAWPRLGADSENLQLSCASEQQG